jgi:hypothetical protein
LFFYKTWEYALFYFLFYGSKNALNITGAFSITLKPGIGALQLFTGKEYVQAPNI